MKHIKHFFFALFVVLAFGSCETYSDDFAIEYSSIHPLGGQYMVTVADETGDVVTENYAYLANTVDNSTTKCWIRIGSYTTAGIAINGKINCDVGSLSFSGSDIENLAGNVATSTKTFTVTDGKLVLGGATAPSGTKADAISFTYTNSAYPEKTYTVSGYRYTGWTED